MRSLIVKLPIAVMVRILAFWAGDSQSVTSNGNHYNEWMIETYIYHCVDNKVLPLNVIPYILSTPEVP